MPVRIPSQRAATNQVARHIASRMASGDIYETTGMTSEGLTTAEVKRLKKASLDIQSRLGKLVKPE